MASNNPGRTNPSQAQAPQAQAQSDYYDPYPAHPPRAPPTGRFPQAERWMQNQILRRPAYVDSIEWISPPSSPGYSSDGSESPAPRSSTSSSDRSPSSSSDRSPTRYRSTSRGRPFPRSRSPSPARSDVSLAPGPPLPPVFAARDPSLPRGPPLPPVLDPAPRRDPSLPRGPPLRPVLERPGHRDVSLARGPPLRPVLEPEPATLPVFYYDDIRPPGEEIPKVPYRGRGIRDLVSLKRETADEAVLGQQAFDTREVLCDNCEEHGHSMADCPAPPADRIWCMNCRELGHKSYNCPEQCENCHQPGHPKWFCKYPCFDCGSKEHFRGHRECKKCTRCRQHGHHQTQCPNPIVCRLCGLSGHSDTTTGAKECKVNKKRRADTRKLLLEQPVPGLERVGNDNNPALEMKKHEMQCDLCEGMGHGSYECRILCLHCLEPHSRHTWTHCPNPVKCLDCGIQGHKRYDKACKNSPHVSTGYHGERKVKAQQSQFQAFLDQALAQVPPGPAQGQAHDYAVQVRPDSPVKQPPPAAPRPASPVRQAPPAPRSPAPAPRTATPGHQPGHALHRSPSGHQSPRPAPPAPPVKRSPQGRRSPSPAPSTPGLPSPAPSRQDAPSLSTPAVPALLQQMFASTGGEKVSLLPGSPRPDSPGKRSQSGRGPPSPGRGPPSPGRGPPSPGPGPQSPAPQPFPIRFSGSPEPRQQAPPLPVFSFDDIRQDGEDDPQVPFRGIRDLVNRKRNSAVEAESGAPESPRPFPIRFSGSPEPQPPSAPGATTPALQRQKSAPLPVFSFDNIRQDGEDDPQAPFQGRGIRDLVSRSRSTAGEAESEEDEEEER